MDITATRRPRTWWTVDGGRWIVETRLCTVEWMADSGQWTWMVVGGQWTVDMDGGQRKAYDGQWAVDNGQWTVDSGRWTVDVGQWTVDVGRWKVDSGRWIVAGGWRAVVDDSSRRVQQPIYQGSQQYGKMNNSFAARNIKFHLARIAIPQNIGRSRTGANAATD